jgi:hypothetical protein
LSLAEIRLRASDKLKDFPDKLSSLMEKQHKSAINQFMEEKDRQTEIETRIFRRGPAITEKREQ